MSPIAGIIYVPFMAPATGDVFERDFQVLA